MMLPSACYCLLRRIPQVRRFASPAPCLYAAPRAADSHRLPARDFPFFAMTLRYYTACLPARHLRLPLRATHSRLRLPAIRSSHQRPAALLSSRALHRTRRHTTSCLLTGFAMPAYRALAAFCADFTALRNVRFAFTAVRYAYTHTAGTIGCCYADTLFPSQDQIDGQSQ